MFLAVHGYRSSNKARMQVLLDKLVEEKIDLSHWTALTPRGRGWKRPSYASEQIFCKDSRYTARHQIVLYLRERGLIEYRCADCGLVEWRGQPIALHLDHVNGVSDDNRIENLRFLCPNCHQQTSTWGRKGRGRIPSPEELLAMAGKFRTQAALAASLGLSGSYVSKALKAARK